MGLFLRQDEQRTELQTRVAAEMQERLRQKPAMQADDTEPAMLRDYQVSKHMALNVTIIVAILVVLGIVILFQAS